MAADHAADVSSLSENLQNVNIKDPWETWNNKKWEQFSVEILKMTDGVKKLKENLDKEKPQDKRSILINKDMKKPHVYGVVVETIECGTEGVTDYTQFLEDWKLVKIGYTASRDDKRENRVKTGIHNDNKYLTASILFLLPLSATKQDKTKSGEAEKNVRRNFGLKLSKDLAKELKLHNPTEWVLTRKEYIREFNVAMAKIDDRVPSTDIFDAFIKFEDFYEKMKEGGEYQQPATTQNVPKLELTEWLKLDDKGQVQKNAESLPITGKLTTVETWKDQDWKAFSDWFYKKDENGDLVINQLNYYCKKYQPEIEPFFIRRDNVEYPS